MSHSLITQLQQQRKAAWDQAKAILDTAAAAKRDLTPAENSSWTDLNEELDAIDARVKSIRDREQREADIQKAFADLGTTPHGKPAARDGSGYLNLRSLGHRLRTEAERAGEYSIRGLLASGSTAVNAEVLTEPVSMGKPSTALLDLLPVRTIEGSEYGYLRQTARTNNAAPVAVGAAKPESVMTLTRISGSLNVVAHVSEAIHEPWLTDNAALQQFVQQEMGTGIGTALEDELLNLNPPAW